MAVSFDPRLRTALGQNQFRRSCHHYTNTTKKVALTAAGRPAGGALGSEHNEYAGSTDALSGVLRQSAVLSHLLSANWTHKMPRLAIPARL
jgi:hypothetical protein